MTFQAELDGELHLVPTERPGLVDRCLDTSATIIGAHIRDFGAVSVGEALRHAIITSRPDLNPAGLKHGSDNQEGYAHTSI